MFFCVYLFKLSSWFKIIKIISLRCILQSTTRQTWLSWSLTWIITVNRNDWCEPKMSNSVKVTLTSCFDSLNSVSVVENRADSFNLQISVAAVQERCSYWLFLTCSGNLRFRPKHSNLVEIKNRIWADVVFRSVRRLSSYFQDVVRTLFRRYGSP